MRRTIHAILVDEAVPAASSENVMPFSDTAADTDFSEPPAAATEANAMSPSPSPPEARVSDEVEPVQTYSPQECTCQARSPSGRRRAEGDADFVGAVAGNGAYLAARRGVERISGGDVGGGSAYEGALGAPREGDADGLSLGPLVEAHAYRLF